jgi:DNA-directed RNA polymerase specialized sigma subunit
MWTSARLAELYLYSDKTLEGVSKDIGVSKSTSYLHVKRIKKHLKEKIQNPFR